SSDERDSPTAAPRGSVIAVAIEPVDGTKHIKGIGQRTFGLGTPTVEPCGPTSQKLLRAPRRPVKASGSTAGAGPGVVVGWRRDHGNDVWVPGPAHRPVRERLGGRAAFRNLLLVLGL